MKLQATMLLLMLLLGFTVQAQQPTKSSDPNAKWQLKGAASDEFDNGSIDWTKWMESSGLPNTTGWKWDNKKNAQLKDGVVELTMRQNENNESDGGTYFKSGILKSYQTFTTGYFEARMKGAAIGKGVCPAFWLYSNFDYKVQEGETVYSEIDIVELQQFDWYKGHGDDIYDMDLNLHCVVKTAEGGAWQRPKAFADTQMNKWRVSWDPRDDYHVYGCEVSEEEIIWYVDGIEVARKPNTYWHRPMNVTASLGLRAPFVKFQDNANHAVNPETDDKAKAALPGMPTSMSVDYIRVWERTDVTEPAPPAMRTTIENGGFELGNLDNWDDCSGKVSALNNNTATGDYCGQIENSSLGQIVELEPNTDYILKGTGKMDAENTFAFMGITLSPKTDWKKNFKYTITEYAKGEIKFTTGDTKQKYRVWYWSASKAYIDDISLQKVGEDPDPDPTPDPEPDPIVGKLPEIGDLVWLKAYNGNYLSVNQSTNNNIEATKLDADAECVFEVVDGGNGTVGLKSYATEQYLSLSTDDDIIRCNATALNDAQKFALESALNDNLKLRSFDKDELCSLDNPDQFLRGNSLGTDDQQTFSWGIYTITSNDDIYLPSTEAIELYPNPVRDILYIHPLNVKHDIEIYTSNGTLIKKERNVNSVNVSTFPHGVYLLRTEGKTKKFIVSGK